MNKNLSGAIAVSLALLLAGSAEAKEEISVDVSDLEANPQIMKKFDKDLNGQLSESELEAYITWLESGGDGTVNIVEGTSWVFVRHGKPILYWRPPPRRPLKRPLHPKKPLLPRQRPVRPLLYAEGATAPLKIIPRS